MLPIVADNVPVFDYEFEADKPEWKSEDFRMNAVKQVVAIALCAAAFTLPSSSCLAQQVTGELGAPNATTTIEGKQLPPPDPNFGGVIKEKASESTPWWPARIVPPKGAPNILLIMTDDEGFGAPSTFGGVIETPALDRIAKADCGTRSSIPRRYAHPHAPL